MQQDLRSWYLAHSHICSRLKTSNRQRWQLRDVQHWLLAGNGKWLDKGRQQCLVLWKKLEEWAATVYGLVRELGMQEAVMTVDELSSGDEVRGTGAHASLHGSL